MRSHLRHLPHIALLCGIAIALLPSLASSATTASVEALNEGSGLYGETHRWSPAQVAVTTNGGKVTFANNSASVPHGIIWSGGPATPACEEGAGKVPVGVGHSGYSWSGACTFTQSGTYSYYCSVHGPAMSGTVYVNAAGVLPPTATTEAATSITENDATLRGAIDPNGQPTSYYFNYGATASYGEKTTELSVGSDSASHLLSAPVSGLAAGTTYHFQIIAIYASGASTVLGGDRTFLTASPSGPEETPTTETPPPPPPTTTTTTATTPTPQPIASAAAGPPPPSSAGSLAASTGSPLAGSASSAIKLASAQHGSSVHGSLAISPAGAGSRLEVDLLAASASLARKHATPVRIGRYLRAFLAAGSVSFSVSLNAQAKRALHRRHRLPIVVQITIAPLHGTAFTTTRSVTLRG